MMFHKYDMISMDITRGKHTYL